MARSGTGSIWDLGEIGIKNMEPRLSQGLPQGQDNLGRKTSSTSEARAISGTLEAKVEASNQENIEQGPAIELKELMASIQERLEQVPPLSGKGCIVRVPRALRIINEEAYTPQAVSIGPCHHGKDRLQAMEEHKVRYLSDFFRRRPKNTLMDFIGHLKEMEETVRLCYESPIRQTSNKLVEIMLVDGCFIIELLFKFREYKPEVVTRDPLFHNNSMRNALRVDMLLLENQLPLSVLQRLFELFTDVHEQNFFGMPFLDLVLHFFRFNGHFNLAQDRPRIKGEEDGEIEHFLDLLRECCLPSFPKAPIAVVKEPCVFIPSATELNDAGVKFRKGSGCCLDIRFSCNGIFEIPILRVEDYTEIFFRNLIAFEQCFKAYDKQYITHYLVLMDYLINSPSDVATLRHEGIIANWLGDNEQVSVLFNRIVQGVSVDHKVFYFRQLFKDVNKYYETPWHSIRAKLRREYCYSPWATASSCAVFIVVVCTIISAVCSVISAV